MKIETRRINELISPEYNPRQISNEELTKLKNSIDTFGYVEPIIVNDVNNHILGGNQRFRAMKELGYKEIECNIVHLPNPNDEKALNLALNKISGDWDNEKLQEILEDLKLDDYEIELTGFDEIEIEEIILDETDDEEPLERRLPKNPDEFWEKYGDDRGEIIYEPGESNWQISDLYKPPDDGFDDVLNKVKNEELRDMLYRRKEWFTEFNFKKIADYYCNQATPEEQRAIELLGLVLVDAGKLIENGYVKMMDEYISDPEIYKLED